MLMIATLCLASSMGVVPDDPPESERPLPLEIAVPKRSNARWQLEYARGLKNRLGERKESEREFWRDLAIEAYQAVRVHHPEEVSIGAEAAFRAGELLRTDGRTAEAAAEFESAARLGRGGPFECRALIERGHLARRDGEPRRALDYYHDVVAKRTAGARQRDDAWYWIGRMQRDLGRFDDAFRAWKTVAHGNGDTLDRIVAFDWWACTLLERQDPNGAAGVLHDCSIRMREAALEETRNGERVRRALERMRARSRLIDELERARNAKVRSSENDRLSRKA